MLQKTKIKKMSFDVLFMQILHFTFIVKLKGICIMRNFKFKEINKFEKILCNKVKKKTSFHIIIMIVL